MKFKLSFNWSYDPLGVISSMRVEQKSTSYVHIANLEIEQYANLEE